MVSLSSPKVSLSSPKVSDRGEKSSARRPSPNLEADFFSGGKCFAQDREQSTCLNNRRPRFGPGHLSHRLGLAALCSPRHLGNSHANADLYQHPHVHTHAHGNADANLHQYPYVHTHAHGNTDVNLHEYPHVHAHVHTHGNADAHADKNTRASPGPLLVGAPHRP